MSGSRALLLVVIALMGSSCGGCGDGGFAPCEFCGPDEACFYKEVCSDGGCELEPVACTSRCELTACEEGHECVPQDVGEGVRQICDPRCDSVLCDPREECLGFGCWPVECGEVTDCLDETAICDAVINRCYPFDGRCASSADCPRFDGAVDEIATISCDEGYCRLAPGPLAEVDDLETDEDVILEQPLAGTSFDTAEDLTIRWDGPRGDAIVLVLDGVPSVDELLDHALWGVSVPSDAPRSVTFAQGHAIVEGAWTDRTAELPGGQVLYVLVQIVEPGRLLAANPPTPFLVGGAWPSPGSPCADRGAIAGSCSSPMRLQGCHPTLGTCTTLCLSSRDCVDLGLQCGDVRDGVRYCE